MPTNAEAQKQTVTSAATNAAMTAETGRAADLFDRVAN
jgi:hypothetical protein